MVAAAVVGSAVVGAGASIAAGNKQAKAAKDAANMQREAASEEIAFQREARDDANRILTPYSNLGNQARDRYYAARGLTPSTAGYTTGAAANDYENSFLASPDWQDAQYSTAQALGALQSTNGALGRGSAINSGKALRAASDITQGYRAAARSGYDNALLSAVDLGVMGDSGRASGGQNFANNAASATRSAAQQAGQYGLAAANAQANGLAGAAAFGSYGVNSFLNRPTSYNPPINPSAPISTIDYANMPTAISQIRSISGL